MPTRPKSRPWAGTTPSRTGCTSRLWPDASPSAASRHCVGEEVDVVGMAPEEECQHEMFVLIRWERRALAVPLAQLEGIAVDEQTGQVIEDWQYWVAQGYEL
jgi:hypothetical protein